MTAVPPPIEPDLLSHLGSYPPDCALCGQELYDDAPHDHPPVVTAVPPPTGRPGEPDMTGDEHYREAERLLTDVLSGYPHHAPESVSVVAEAQVHATLALAAAIASVHPADDGYGRPS